MPSTDRKLRVFLCHASEDTYLVRALYQRLEAEGWIDPWLDEKNLLPGHDWDLKIRETIRDVDIFVACLSNDLVNKKGYVQKELKFALDVAMEQPEGVVFIVPLRLHDCLVPQSLTKFHWADYFPSEQRDLAYGSLMKSFIEKAKSLNIPIAQSKAFQNDLESVINSSLVLATFDGFDIRTRENNNFEYMQASIDLKLANGDYPIHYWVENPVSLGEKSKLVKDWWSPSQYNLKYLNKNLLAEINRLTLDGWELLDADVENIWITRHKSQVNKVGSLFSWAIFAFIFLDLAHFFPLLLQINHEVIYYGARLYLRRTKEW